MVLQKNITVRLALIWENVVKLTICSFIKFYGEGSLSAVKFAGKFVQMMNTILHLNTCSAFALQMLGCQSRVWWAACIALVPAGSSIVCSVSRV